jgi:integrase
MPAKPRHPLVRDFLATHRLDWSEDHRRNAVSAFNRFDAWLAGDLIDATMEDTTTYLAERAAVVGKSTLMKDYQFLTWLYAWLHDEGELPGRSPMAKVKSPGDPPHDPARTPHVSEDDYERLMGSFDKRKTLDCRNAAICSLMYRSGLRGIEVVRADLDRLDLDGATLDVFGKSGQWETVPLAVETVALIERYLRRRGSDRMAPLFLGANGATLNRGGRLKRQAISEMLERRGRVLGIHVPAHAFRRAMAINGKVNGLNDTTVQHIGRWKDGRMVARYQRNAQAEMAAAEFHANDPTARATPRRRRLRAV